MEWKVVSQRNWLKGLQATFGRFAQPVGILRRLSNMLYDKRGALRQSDGSFIFARPGFAGPFGATLEFFLYQPRQVNAYYVALQKSLAYQVAAPTGVVVTALTLGGNVASASRNGSLYTVVTSAPHNLAAAIVTPPQSFPQGSLSINIPGVFVGIISLSAITVFNNTTFSFLGPRGLPPATAVAGTVGTQLALLGTYTYDVTAADGVGGETPASGTPGTVTLVGGQNAIRIAWAIDNSSGHNVYRTAGAPTGSLNPGPGKPITANSYVDIGQVLAPGQTPPLVNTTQTLVFRIINAASYSIAILAQFPTSLLPVLGGILGAVEGSAGSTASSGLGPTANGGVVGNTGPLPQIVQFANKLILALGNGYAPQEFLDGSTITTGGGGAGATFPPASSPTANATVSQSGAGSTTAVSGAITGFPSQPVAPASVTITMTINGMVTASNGGAGAQFEVSPDGGATWATVYSFGGGSNQTFPSQTVTVPAPAIISNLNTVQVRISVNAGAGLGGSSSATAQISGCYLTVGLGGATGGNGACVPVSNTFTAQYPDWQPSVAFNQGDTIKDSVTGGLFKALQGGTTAATRPGFTNVLAQDTNEVTPGTITWQCIAISALGAALRGAAHALVYAGSLWLLNTYPSTTDDQLDGPNCIKMSDLNNPESWNPVNIAFLDRDDGDEITGGATFTIAEAGIAPTGSLTVFKYFKTYQITGVFGALDFSIQQAQTALGCIAPRTIQFVTGFGIARLTHLGFAYFNGVRDSVFSEEIRPFLFADPTEPDIVPIDWNSAYFAKAAPSSDPPMYVAALPLLPQPLAGFVFAPGSVGAAFSIYLRASKVVAGIEQAISSETMLLSGTNAFIVTSPAAQAGVTYRVYAGNQSNAENLFIEQPSFTAQAVTLATMTGGFAPLALLTRLFCYDMVQKQWAIVDLPFTISALKQIRAPGGTPLTVGAGSNDGCFRRLFAADAQWDTGADVAWSLTGAELFQEGGSAKMYYRRVVVRARIASDTPNIKLAINLDGAQGIARKPTSAKQVTPGFWDFRMDIGKDAESVSATLSGSGPVTMVIESMDWHIKPKPSGTPVTIQK